MDGGARVTTVVVGLLIAFCAVILAKWLAVVALAALLLAVVLRVALRRVVRAVRRRRTPAGVEPAGPGTVTAVHRTVDRAAGPRRPGGVAPVTMVGPPCSWCGLVGGHRDAEGRPVRPRHAHVLPAPARRAS